MDLLKVAFERLPLHPQHIYTFLGAFMSLFCMGHAVDGIAVAFPALKHTFGRMPATRLALVMSMLMIGATISAIASGYLADRYGRRTVLRWVIPVGLLAQLLCVVAPTFNLLLAGRFLVGASICVGQVVTPTLLSEVCPAKARWLFVTFPQGWPLGVMTYTLILSYFGWRAAFAAGIPVSLLFLVLLFVPWGIPESPKFLCGKGDRATAEAQFLRMGGKLPLAVSAEGDEQLKAEAQGEAADSTSTVMTRGVKVLVLCAAVVTYCQGSSSQGMKTWLPTIIKRQGIRVAGGGQTAALYCLMNVLEVVGAWVFVFLTARATAHSADDELHEAGAPVFILRLGQVCCVMAGLTVLAFFFVRTPAQASVLGGLHLVWQGGLFVYITSYATLCFPAAVRARCVSLCMLASYLGATVGPSVGAKLLDILPRAVGPKAILLFNATIYIVGYLGSLGLMRR